MKFLYKTRRGLLLSAILIFGTIYGINKYAIPHEPDYLHQMHVSDRRVFLFDGVKGPMTASVIRPKVRTSWKQFNTPNLSAFCILLTDTASEWLGLAQGLGNIGVPFTITNNVDEALKHKTILVYPTIDGQLLTRQQLQQLAAVPRRGGTLIATNVMGGGLNEVFGFDSVLPSMGRSQLLLHPTLSPLMNRIFKDSAEQQIRISNPRDYQNVVPTNGYTSAKTPLITFEDGTSCLTYKDYGVGRSYAFGLDIGSYILRNLNERGFNGSRAYVNKFEAGIDLLLRLLKEIYTTNQPDAVTIGTVPYNKDFTLVLTHDIDFTKSIVNTVAYAAMEKSEGVEATYFIQTKYIKDWNDDIFFNQVNVKHLLKIQAMGMEIGSHSVSHSRVFSKFPQGTGTEKYPLYRPFVKDKRVMYNGSILGELRVSKFLLETEVPGLEIRSFRPGHLQYPFSLPQSLEAVGYSYSSSVTANNVQTHLPYLLTYNREFDAVMNIVEIPVTVEDEAGLPMLQRFDSAAMLANQLSAYGGVMNVLIHTDTLGQKFEFEQRLIRASKGKAWFSTIRDFGKWWATRYKVHVSVATIAGKHMVTVTNASGQQINGLCLHVPAGWQAELQGNTIKQEGNAIIINELKEQIAVGFR